MIKYGRSIRWFNDYMEEVEFSKRNKFDFMQIWFMKGEILLDKVLYPKEKTILHTNYPVMIHAVFDMDDFRKYSVELIRVLRYLDHQEVIIHPICESQPITSETIDVLANHIYETNLLLKEHDITLFIENNSAIDKINYTAADLKKVFEKNPDVELLLDVAHIDSYQHLQEIISVKYPKCLHVADKHFNLVHEHLPIGKGELDYELIISHYLKGFNGKIILEVTDTDEEIIDSINKIQKMFLDR